MVSTSGRLRWRRKSHLSVWKKRSDSTGVVMPDTVAKELKDSEEPGSQSQIILAEKGVRG